MRLALSGLAIAVVAGAAFYSISRSAPTVEQTHILDNAECAGDYVAAALRNDGEGWYAIQDKEHRPINIKSVVTTNSEILVYYAQPARTVHSLIVTPDETLAKSYTMGSSVGTDRAAIRIYENGWFARRAVDPSTITTAELPWSNLWVFGLMEFHCT